MRDAREAPNQLALDFDFTREAQDFTRVERLSNVVAVDFGQHRDAKTELLERQEADVILEHVLSNARKLSW
jgi:hypothetical protein